MSVETIPFVSIDELGSPPIGAPARSAHAVYWYPRAELRDLASWGHPDVGDARFLETALAAEVGEGAPRYRSFVDLRGVEQIDRQAFAHFVVFMERQRDRFAELVRASAMVVNPSLPAAAAAGYSRLLGDPFPSEVFREPGPAFDWLGSTGGDEWQTFGDLVARAMRNDLRQQLYDLFLRTGARTSLAKAAALIGLSARSPQRELAALGTSYGIERRRVRIARAKELLANTDWKLYAIAAELGFAKTSSFISMFRQQTGVTPGAWRDGKRPKP